MATEKQGTIEPLAIRVPQATQISGISRSELYRRAKQGQLEIIKLGTSSLITMVSLKHLIATLPRK